MDCEPEKWFMDCKLEEWFMDHRPEERAMDCKLVETLETLRTALEGKGDNAFAPLLAAVREPCPGEHFDDWPHQHCYAGVVRIEKSVVDRYHERPCTTCEGAGYVTRTDFWLTAPDGAQEGALIRALGMGLSAYKLAGILTRLLYQAGDTRQAALELVLAAMRKP